ncbi:unnamed protein product [Sphacelaria rigidula]
MADKPMTIKERMAALAKASGGGGAGPTPGPPLQSASPATGSSVAERLAKMRRGGSDPNRQKAPDLVRTSTPPASSGATSTEPKSPASSQATGGSSIASRIAMLSSVGSASTSSSSAQVPPSPGATSTLTPALGRTTSAASSTNENADSAAGGCQPTSESSTESPRVSPGLAARMQAMSVKSSATTVTASGGDTGERSGERGESFPPPPPGFSSSAVGAGGLSPSRVSRGISARMEVCYFVRARITVTTGQLRFVLFHRMGASLKRAGLSFMFLSCPTMEALTVRLMKLLQPTTVSWPDRHRDA